jgi:hypothetical protein
MLRKTPLFSLLLAMSGCAAMGGPVRAATETPAPVVAAPRAPTPSADKDSDGIPDSKDSLPLPEDQPDMRIAGPAQDAAASTTPATERNYLIYTAHLTMAVYQVESALARVEGIGVEVGGHLASRTDKDITIRVPRARFEEAIQKVEATGDVVHRDISAEDVSDEYVDTEVRLKNARAMRDRLAELLAKAPVKEAIEIEKELGRVTEAIERLEGRLKLLKDKIAFSTITVTFDARTSSLKTLPLRLPFPWLATLGLPTLLRLDESK